MRIISLISSATEILYGLGLGDFVVAVSHECDFPHDARNKPRVTFSRIDATQSSSEIDAQVNASTLADGLYGFDRQAIRELRPDLIVTQSQCDVCAIRYEDVAGFVATEKALEGTRLIDLQPHRLEDVFSDVHHVASATGNVESAKQYVDALRARVERVRQATAHLDDTLRPRVACIEWSDPIMLAANWTPELIHVAGGRCPNDAGQHSSYSAWDEVRAYDPEVIVVSPCGFDLARCVEEAHQLAAMPGWSDVAAVQDRRVFAVDGNAYLNRSGPRLVDSIEILAHLLQPTLFPRAIMTDGWCAVST